jgi:hypothetical protein
VFRLELRSSSGAPAEASVRFIGNEEFPPRLFQRTVLDAGLPGVAVAGSVSTVGVRVRNDNRVVWRSGGRFPIYVSYKIRGADGIETEGARTSFQEPVRPSAALETPIEIRWPSEPGLYQVRVDLVAEGVAWFENKTGAPLAVATVEVVDAMVSNEESPDVEPKGSGG